MGAADRYCGACGTVRTEHLERVRARHQRDRRTHTRAMLAVAIGFVMAMALPTVIEFALLGDEESESEWSDVLLSGLSGILAIGGVALTLGMSAIRTGIDSLGPLRVWIAAPFLAAGTFAISHYWVELLRVSADASAEIEALSTVVWLYIVIGAPLIEELLCRWAIFGALRQVVGVRQSVVVAAAIFAMLHALNGGIFLELPHRFLVGIGLGWIRVSGGSVWPAVLAHALHNLAAVVTTAG
ncbi:MAG: lysostaphin resistance A-like protein [Planctomycetota bacterium]